MKWQRGSMYPYEYMDGWMDGLWMDGWMDGDGRDEYFING